MKFRCNSLPIPDKGISFVGCEVLTVPDQTLSLAEILERFTRDEALPIGHDVSYDDDAEVDYEKMKYADLVDKAEFADRMKQKAKEIKEILDARDAENAAAIAAEKAEMDEVKAELRNRKKAAGEAVNSQ